MNASFSFLPPGAGRSVASRSVGSVLAAAGGALLFAGCSSINQPLYPVAATPVPIEQPASMPSVPGDWLKPSNAPYTLGPGDKVVVSIAGEENSRVETVVAPDGRIYYQMLQGIDVWGKTLAETAQSLEAQLHDYYNEQPHVNVELADAQSKQVWVLGRLRSPGLYPLRGPTTLLDAIAEAGGPMPGQVNSGLNLPNGATLALTDPRRDAGDLSRAFVVREGHPLRVDIEKLLREGDMSQNIYLKPDDLVYLPAPRPSEVFVLGEVGQASAVRTPGEPTLIAAIASAGGTTPDAYLSQVAVVRGSVNAPAIAIYDYKAILTGLAPDVRLEPNDIVFVPRAPYSVIQRYLDLIVTTFVRTVGVNAGARAADVNTDLTVAVPVGP